MNIKIEKSETKGVIVFRAIENDKPIGRLALDINEAGNQWTISEWFIDKEYSHQGRGTLLLHNALCYAFTVFGRPNELLYTWNGENQYVMDWLERVFGARCICPVAVLKHSSDDIWDAHKYSLDLSKVLEFINSQREDLENDEGFVFCGS